MKYMIYPHPFEIETDADPEKDSQSFIDDVIDEIAHGDRGMDFEWCKKEE